MEYTCFCYTNVGPVRLFENNNSDPLPKKVAYPQCIGLVFIWFFMLIEWAFQNDLSLQNLYDCNLNWRSNSSCTWPDYDYENRADCNCEIDYREKYIFYLNNKNKSPEESIHIPLNSFFSMRLSRTCPYDFPPSRTHTV